MQQAHHVYRSWLADEGRALAAALDGDPTMPVPSCPGWSITDLVAHVGSYHRWAADLLQVPVSTNAAVPVAGDGFDWNGFYAGVYGVAQSSSDTGSQYGIGLALGAEARFDYVKNLLAMGREAEARRAFEPVAGKAGVSRKLDALARWLIERRSICIWMKAALLLRLRYPSLITAWSLVVTSFMGSS